MKAFIKANLHIIILASFLVATLILSSFFYQYDNGGNSYNGSYHSSSRPEQEYTYYIGNKTTKKYHRPNCSYLPEPGNRITIPKSKIDTTYKSYSPCGHCDP